MVGVLWLLAILFLVGGIVGMVFSFAAGVLGIGLGIPIGIAGFVSFALIAALAEILRALHQIRDDALVPEGQKPALWEERKRARRMQQGVMVVFALVVLAIGFVLVTSR